MEVYKKMEELGISLPKAPAKGGVYTPAKRFGKTLIYISGCGPVITEPVEGKLGAEFTIEQGKVFAKTAC